MGLTTQYALIIVIIGIIVFFFVKVYLNDSKASDKNNTPEDKKQALEDEVGKEEIASKLKSDTHVKEMYDLRNKLLASKDEVEFNNTKEKLIDLIKKHSPKDSSGNHVPIAFIKSKENLYDGIILSEIEIISFEDKGEVIHAEFLSAIALQEGGKHKEAVAIYNKVLGEIFEDDDRRQGDMYFCGKLESDKEIKVIPISGLFFNLGKSYRELELFEMAKQALEFSIDHDPEGNVDSHHYLGIVKVELDDFTSCISDFKNAIKIDENYSHPYYMLAVAYSDDKCKDRDLEIASKYLKKFLELSPDDFEGKILQHLLYKMSGSKPKITSKSEAISFLNVYLNILNNSNAAFSSTNKAKPVFWFNIDPKKFSDDFNLLCLDENELIWYHIPKGEFNNPESSFYLRKDNGLVHIEIPIKGEVNYLNDIKSEVNLKKYSKVYPNTKHI